MKSVFQVVAASVLAQATIAYGADAKSAISNLKKGAAATAADAKAKAAEVTKDAKAQANEAKTSAQDVVTEATKKAEPAPAQTASSAPVTASDVKGAAQEVKEELSKQGDASGLAGTQKSLIIPESAVLPQNVVRFRAIYASAQSTKGYDANANKIENGLKITANRSVAVLEYGITEKISAQLLVPYFLNGKVTVDNQTKFNAVAKQKVDAGVAAALQQVKDGLTAAGAGALYTLNLPAPQEIVIDAARNIKIPAGANVKDFVDVTLAGAFAAQGYATAKTDTEATKFQEGLGDVEIGAKYALSTVNAPWFSGVPFYTSVALGVRLNTGSYLDAKKDGKELTSRGTTDLGLRLNADYELINGLQLQVENQSEFMLAKGKTFHDKEEVDLERDGARQVGYTKLVLAPGTWVEPLNVVVLNARYNWDNDAATKVHGKSEFGKKTSVGRSAQFGLGFDGLKMKLPVQLDYDYVLAARSRNVSAAFDAHVATLKLFYKF